jgi:hypothetical protein
MEGVIEVNPARVGTLHAGSVEVPYVGFGQIEPAIKLVYEGEDYWYVRTLPLRGYGTVMARHIRELEGDGKKLLLARFRDRIYIYATGVTPIGTGKK